jgi:hypothetical protein
MLGKDGAKAMIGTRQSIRCSMLVATGLVLAFVVSPAQAVTCDEVRALSPTELSNWAKRLKVSRADLVVLLEQSFCQPKTPSGVIVAARK